MNTYLYKLIYIIINEIDRNTKNRIKTDQIAVKQNTHLYFIKYYKNVLKKCMKTYEIFVK